MGDLDEASRTGLDVGTIPAVPAPSPWKTGGDWGTFPAASWVSQGADHDFTAAQAVGGVGVAQVALPEDILRVDNLSGVHRHRHVLHARPPHARRVLAAVLFTSLALPRGAARQLLPVLKTGLAVQPEGQSVRGPASPGMPAHGAAAALTPRSWLRPPASHSHTQVWGKLQAGAWGSFGDTRRRRDRDCKPDRQCCAWHLACPSPLLHRARWRTPYLHISRRTTTFHSLPIPSSRHQGPAKLLDGPQSLFAKLFPQPEATIPEL